MRNHGEQYLQAVRKRDCFSVPREPYGSRSKLERQAESLREWILTKKNQQDGQETQDITTESDIERVIERVNLQKIN